MGTAQEKIPRIIVYGGEAGRLERGFKPAPWMNVEFVSSDNHGGKGFGDVASVVASKPPDAVVLMTRWLPHSGQRGFIETCKASGCEVIVLPSKKGMGGLIAELRSRFGPPEKKAGAKATKSTRGNVALAIGHRLRTARRRAGITNEQVAERIWHTSSSGYGNYETGRSLPSKLLIYDASKLFGCPADELVKGDEWESLRELPLRYESRLKERGMAEAAPSAEAEAEKPPSPTESSRDDVECPSCKGAGCGDCEGAGRVDSMTAVIILSVRNDDLAAEVNTLTERLDAKASELVSAKDSLDAANVTIATQAARLTAAKEAAEAHTRDADVLCEMNASLSSELEAARLEPDRTSAQAPAPARLAEPALMEALDMDELLIAAGVSYAGGTIVKAILYGDNDRAAALFEKFNP